jgi:hypothetical protein
MQIVADGYERYVLSNEARIRRVERSLKIEVYKKYKAELEQATFLRRYYLRVRRWLELRRNLAQLDRDLAGNLYFTLIEDKNQILLTTKPRRHKV